MALTEFSEANYRSRYGWLTYGDGSPLIGVIYVDAAHYPAYPESVATSTDGRGFHYYDSIEEAAEETGASTVLFLGEGAWNRVLNERP